MKRHSIEVLAHQELTEADLGELRLLFDNEYLKEFGEWDPQEPYGYASHDVHIMARIEGRVIGHVGWAHREIAVGTETLAIAGVGGVLISADARGMRLGRELMSWAAQSMRDRGRLAFGYLGCLDGDDSLVEMAEDAIERNLQIIGEAANHLPAAITDAHPDIAWPQIRGFRNILVHQYFGVGIEIVRDVVETHLSRLAKALRANQPGS
ncbi:GNAT family N-acetyltransferase [Gulosibacter faecalis]|uniref:GNAT family N-acetyltransferase n=1 Tax=Gulosibacter faecalis TaxID=272240 RepID=A0ABW5UY28_9MICO|nr:GNAT family N-acetyltransferase [Gulosibacter faecalis]